MSVNSGQAQHGTAGETRRRGSGPLAPAFVVMAVSGFLAGGLILLGIRATGRSLQNAVPEPDAAR